jgi:hypothetical protein
MSNPKDQNFVGPHSDETSEPRENPSSENAPDNMGVVTSLLKAPKRVLEAIAEERDLVRGSMRLLAAAMLCHAGFGVAIGFFGGTWVAVMDFVKVPLIALFSMIICFPSLYVFTCVAGTPMSLSQVFALGSSCLAMMGLLLAGLAPVAWLFAVSTASVPFMVILVFCVWIIALVFAARYVDKMSLHPRFKLMGGIRVWFFIFIMVTLQMTTHMRPLLVKPENAWKKGEKQFFLLHFIGTFSSEDN